MPKQVSYIELTSKATEKQVQKIAILMTELFWKERKSIL